MATVSLAAPSGRHLSLAEREEIAILRAGGCGVREVARRLDRSPSTISQGTAAQRREARRPAGLTIARRTRSGTRTGARGGPSRPSSSSKTSYGAI
jgi:IS30 family transposase